MYNMMSHTSIHISSFEKNKTDLRTSKLCYIWKICCQIYNLPYFSIPMRHSSSRYVLKSRFFIFGKRSIS